MQETLRNKTIKGFVWNAIENFANQIVTFIIGIILARLLSPSDYGLLAMITIFLAISTAFIDSGFGNALIRKQDLSEEDCSTAFYFNIIIASIAYIIIFFIAPWVAAFYDHEILTPLLRTEGIMLILGAFVIVQKNLITKRIDFKTTGKISVSSNILSGFLGVWMAYNGYGVWSLVGMGISQNILQLFLFWYYSTWRPQWMWNRTSFSYLWGYGSKLLASGLLQTIFQNIYPLIIGKMFSPASLGFYTRAQGYAQLPSTNLTGIIQRVTFPVLSEIQEDHERLAENYRRILKMAAFIVFPIMIGLSALSKPLISLMLTEKWEISATYLQIICFAMMWYPIHAINLNLLQVKGRSDLFLKLEIVKKIITLTIMFCSIPFGIIAICWGTVLDSFLSLIINTHYTGKLMKIGFFVQIKDYLPFILLSAIMGVLILLVSNSFEDNALKLLLGILSGGTFYLFCAYLLKLEELKELFYNLRRIKF